jgi:hypothetical protein
MSQHHDLGVLGRLAPAQQHQSAEYPDHEDVKEMERHENRSCPYRRIRSIRRSSTLRRLLKRYRHRLVMHPREARTSLNLINQYTQETADWVVSRL